MGIWARMRNWRGCVSDGGKNCYMWTNTDYVSQPNLLRGHPLCQGYQSVSTSGSTILISLSLDPNWVTLWWNDWVSFHDCWTLLLYRLRVCPFAGDILHDHMGFFVHPSDINIISISVQRFSEVPQAGMTMGGPYEQSIVDSPARTCWEGVGVILKEFLD